MEDSNAREELAKLGYPEPEGDKAPSAVVPKACAVLQKQLTKLTAVLDPFLEATDLTELQKKKLIWAYHLTNLELYIFTWAMQIHFCFPGLVYYIWDPPSPSWSWILAPTPLSEDERSFGDQLQGPGWSGCRIDWSAFFGGAWWLYSWAPRTWLNINLYMPPNSSLSLLPRPCMKKKNIVVHRVVKNNGAASGVSGYCCFTVAFVCFVFLITLETGYGITFPSNII